MSLQDRDIENYEEFKEQDDDFNEYLIDEDQDLYDEWRDKQSDIAEEIMSIDTEILNKYNKSTGVALNEPELRKEFVSRVKEEVGVNFDKKVYDELEDNNYHTANAILKEEGFFEVKK